MAISGQVDLPEPGAPDCSHVNLAAIILAAGASRRMGSPKALLPFRGQSFLERAIELYSAYCNPVVAVIGHHAAAIRAAVAARPGVRFVENPEPDRGMLSSLQCGVAALDKGFDGFLFCPVDLPAVDPDTILKIYDGYQHTTPQPTVVIPQLDGRRGHPVLCSAVVADEFLAAPDHTQPRDVIQQHRDTTLFVDVKDPGIISDVDFPEDYQRLLAHHS
jgi:molybdenum cofactor cytidylyltransferase